MKVIQHEAVQHFQGKTPNQSQLQNYITHHRFYSPTIPVSSLSSNIRKVLNSLQPTHKIKLNQLGLYLKRENNKSMFEIYEIVLKHASGITYKDIEKITKLEIINISHYCCRLRKMNFVELRQEKSEKVVLPKRPTTKKQQDEETQTAEFPVPANTFYFNQLSMMKNIWVNVSGVEAYQNGGITNEEIKERVGKPTEGKLMMKIVESAREMYAFEREMISEGKVFENKYRNVPHELKILMEKGEDGEQQKGEKLDENVEVWLKDKFPTIEGENFLFTFINTELKNYLSVSGVKTVHKRTCTPIKLARYMKILNSLNIRWPQTHNELKRYIIEEEKNMHNGTMHKRSIVGILDGLVMKGVLRKNDESYYPEWQPVGEQVLEEEKKIMTEQNSLDSKPKKRVHLNSIKEKEHIGIKMRRKDYQKELQIQFLFHLLKSLYSKKLKKTFNRIIHVRRFKVATKMYEPQHHLLGRLQDPRYHLPDFQATSYADFIQEVDFLIDEHGQKEKQLGISCEVTKFFHRYPKRTEESMKLKFGNHWRDKIEDMLKQNVVIELDTEFKMNADLNHYLI